MKKKGEGLPEKNIYRHLTNHLSLSPTSIREVNPLVFLARTSLKLEIKFRTIYIRNLNILIFLSFL